MREYIKLFNTPASADGYKIVDIPFITTVIGGGVNNQNLHCNESSKKIQIVNNVLSIVDDVTPISMINFNVKMYEYHRDFDSDEPYWDIQYSVPEGTTWADFIDSPLSENLVIYYEDDDVYISDEQGGYTDIYIKNKNNTYIPVSASDEIQNSDYKYSAGMGPLP